MMIKIDAPIDDASPRIFAPCTEPGCDWIVERPASRCPEHGGGPNVQAYRTSGPSVELTIRGLR